MKQVLFIIPLALSLISCSEREIEFGKLVKRQDVYFVSFEDKPYSGRVIITHDGRPAAINGRIKDGKIEGLWRKWHENGQLWDESTYVSGKENGPSRAWNENGQLMWEGTLVDGEPTGQSFTWHENGQLSSEKTWLNGEEDGLQRKWHENGQLLAEGVAANEDFDGLWRFWYENGQLSDEATYVNGLLNGLYRKWSEEGDLTDEGHWINNQKAGLHTYYCYPPNPHCDLRHFDTTEGSVEKNDGIYKEVYCFFNDKIVGLSNCSE